MTATQPPVSLPIVQCLPHGGLGVPTEVRDLLAIDATTIYNECDLWVDDLFDFAALGVAPLARVTFDIARVLIDANRPPDRWEDPDGAIKTATSYGEAIYQTPLSHAQRHFLLDRYWRDFQEQLGRALDTHASQTQLFLDCHNMAQIGPAAYGDAGQVRPLICLANFGDERGEPVAHRGQVSCPPALLRAAGEIAAGHFADLPLLQPGAVAAPIVALNRPFAGGYLLRTMTDRLAATKGDAVPGIMIEINRGLFVGSQTPRTPIAPPNTARIAEIRRRLYLWVTDVLSLL